ncbi:hypothetical protein OAZ06_00025 [Synechococcus sp. AH-736-G20]|nr:hypothetical protein [Synechococcus sp. AH-736-G20]
MPLTWTLPPPMPPPPVPRWELIGEPVLPVQADQPGSRLQPLSAEQVDVVVNSTPLQRNDFRPLLRLSPLVPTAMTLPEEQWRIHFGTISPFDSGEAGGTGNQNYAVQLDVGLDKDLLVSAFISQADDPLTAPLKGFAVQPANFWQSYGASARWRWLDEGDWQWAVNGSLEAWEVGSGGDDSFSNRGDNASPNIFNDSGSRVFTRNIVGSLSLPLSWQLSETWQISVAPGITFLPADQGAGQGGAGQFYGTNPYLSGGVLFQPFPELGLTASIAQPIGSGTNSFDADLVFSRVPIFSAGLNWDLNPRIGLRGLLTNGFGATPATALLALPSANRLGYSASFVFTPDAPDTPQLPLSKRQRSLTQGGMTVNTALVPPEDELDLWINTDSGGNLNALLGYSISNVFQLFLFSGGLYNNVPQTTPQARLYANDGAWNWRIGGKATVFSPLRGAPFWGGGRITLGRNSDIVNNTGQGYVFAETMATWEASKRVALNLNPKTALSGAGNLWAVGLSANVQLAPRWQLVPEGNVVVNNLAQSNGTLGLRWQTTDSVALEGYVSTAASLLDVGQLLSADQARWGGRVLMSF